MRFLLSLFSLVFLFFAIPSSAYASYYYTVAFEHPDRPSHVICSGINTVTDLSNCLKSFGFTNYNTRLEGYIYVRAGTSGLPCTIYRNSKRDNCIIGDRLGTKPDLPDIDDFFNPPEEEYTDPDDWPQVDGVDHPRALECFNEATSYCTNGNKASLWQAVYSGGTYYCSTYPNSTCNCTPGDPSCDFSLTKPWPSSPDGGDGGGDGDGGDGGGTGGGGDGGGTGGGGGDGGGTGGGGDGGGTGGGGDGDGTGGGGDGDGTGGGGTGGGGDWGYIPPSGGGNGDGVDLSYIEHLLNVIAGHTQGDNSDIVNAINELAELLDGTNSDELKEILNEISNDNKYLLSEAINRADTANQHAGNIDENLKTLTDYLATPIVDDAEDRIDGLTGFYKPRYESFEKVFTDGLARIEDTPLFDYMDQFRFDSGASSDTTWQVCFDLKMVNFGCAELTIPPYIWAFVRIVMLLSASFVARRMIIGG